MGLDSTLNVETEGLFEKNAPLHWVFRYFFRSSSVWLYCSINLCNYAVSYIRRRIRLQRYVEFQIFVDLAEAIAMLSSESSKNTNQAMKI